MNEIGYSGSSKIITIDKKYYRPTEVDSLIGNFSKAKEELDWEPKIKFCDLVREMIEYDLEYFKNEAKHKS